MNFDLYFERTEAERTRTDITAANDELLVAVQGLKDSLASMSTSWGNDQADFMSVKADLELCITKYEELCGLNNDLCTFVSDYCTHIDSISSNTLGGAQ